MRRNHIRLAIACLITLSAQVVLSQPADRLPHASQWLKAVDRGIALPYLYWDNGTTFHALFGLDTAWDSESNVRRGTAFIGKDYIGTGRISFQPNYFVDENGSLTDAQKTALRNRIDHIKLSGATDVVMNCDHEAMASTDYQYKGKPEEWYRLIKSSVRYAQSLGMNVVTVSPFNEPDYTGWNEGSKADFRAICELLKSDDDFSNIRVSAGNTLNTDYAMEWYEYMKPYVDEGCTHQLAGSFDHYASFFEQVRNDGNYATGDELHNVMEAIVGLEYGMQSGIWWGFDGVARGNFCQANSGSGSRLGYAENRDAWSAGGVYRLPNGKVNAILGTSERQATNSVYQLMSREGAVYYDGEGPMQSYSILMPGGTGYQKGQTSAERCIEITRGEDVPPVAPLLGGTFVIMNKHSKKVIGIQGGSSQAGATVVQQTYNASNPQTHHHWQIEPVSDRVGGDFSYAYIRSVRNSDLRIDVRNWSLESGGQMIVWNGDGGTNEQWYFEYAGDGDFYIRSRHSALCLEVRSSSTANSATIQQATQTGADNQRWRLLPVGTECETEAPLPPSGLTATPLNCSVLLEWEDHNPGTEAAVFPPQTTFQVLRGEQVSSDSIDWNVIGRGIEGTAFLDNTCQPGSIYLYKVKAVDLAYNRSEASNTVSASANGEDGLLARYTFEGTTNDWGMNQLDGVLSGEATYQSFQKREGGKSLYLNGNYYLQLPTTVGFQHSMTLTTWVYWQGGSAWQRIFDFGNGTDEYIFLTPSNGSEMRLAAKHGGEEQILSAPKLSTYHWTHLAVVLGEDGAVLYIDGEEAAKSNALTLRPDDFHPVLNFIGCSQYVADPIFKGCIDDLRIYNYALSADEVAAVMSGTEVGITEQDLRSTVVERQYYDMSGIRLGAPRKGLNIVKEVMGDGSVKSRITIY